MCGHGRAQRRNLFNKLLFELKRRTTLIRIYKYCYTSLNKSCFHFFKQINNLSFIGLICLTAPRHLYPQYDWLMEVVPGSKLVVYSPTEISSLLLPGSISRYSLFLWELFYKCEIVRSVRSGCIRMRFMCWELMNREFSLFNFIFNAFSRWH